MLPSTSKRAPKGAVPVAPQGVELLAAGGQEPVGFGGGVFEVAHGAKWKQKKPWTSPLGGTGRAFRGMERGSGDFRL